MKIEQLYTGCLAQGAYYIESAGEAVIIDPLREVKGYIEKAKANGAVIRYIFETHFHADFVSGHVDLARETGATIVYGPGAIPAFPAQVAEDGEIIPVGEVKFKVLHTPGHTMESACFLLYDEAGKEHALFSGDTLFIGDVGRPDLAQKAAHMTKEELAGVLYDSLRDKVMPLPDDVIVYPAHGAGSACGKNMSKETWDTLGHQKTTNYALRPTLTREGFVVEVTAGLTQPPAYFPENVRLNKEGYERINEVMRKGTQALSAAAFEAAANETGALVLDTRNAQVFARGFIPNSINIGIDGNFAPWVGTLVKDIEQPILIIAEEGREGEVVTRLARVGYDHAIGFLKGGIEAWKAAGKELDQVESVTVKELAARLKIARGGKTEDTDLRIADVRKASEFMSEHMVGAENLPLDYINDQIGKLDRKATYYVYCAGGYRSMIFVSILRARGFDNLVDVQGGLKAIKDSELFTISPFVCPTTML